MEKEIVVKTLERCIGSKPCEGCPFEVRLEHYINFPDCMVELQREALKIIKSMEVNT